MPTANRQLNCQLPPATCHLPSAICHDGQTESFCHFLLSDVAVAALIYSKHGNMRQPYPVSTERSIKYNPGTEKFPSADAPGRGVPWRDGRIIVSRSVTLDL